MLYGIDISNWQAGIDLSKGNYDFCICKATEGTWYKDKHLDIFTSKLTELNKLIGVYHFARPDRNNTIEKMQQEANFFTAEVERNGLLGKSILCLDWETNPMNRSDLMRAWLERVVELTGHIPLVYSSKSQFQSWVGKEEWEFLLDYGVWLAQWPSINQYTAGTNPLMNIQWSPPWGWDIWQYSSNGRLGTNTMRVDLNMANMTREQWSQMASDQREILSDDFQWAIDMGLIKGYGDGTYRENAYLTRGQLATVLRRVYNLKAKNQLNSLYGATGDRFRQYSEER